MNTERITYLFYCHFTNSSTIEEKEELFYYMHHPSYQEEVMVIMEAAWKTYRQEQPFFSEEKSKNLLHNILNHPVEYVEEELPFPTSSHAVPFWRNSRSIAAVVALVVGISLYFLLTFSSTVDVPLAKGASSKSYYKASLTFSDGQQFHLEDLPQQYTIKSPMGAIVKLDSTHIAYQPFTSLIQKPLTHTLSTPKGGQFIVTLPDGSVVWLNAASSISYPAQFSPTSRNIHLTGEAYFEVAKSDKVPFKVNANGTEVEVLGTQFNINAYENEPTVRTTLVEGSVKVHSHSTTKLLQPGEEASILNNEILIKEADLACTLGWKNGIFQFDQTPLTEVMKQLANWYDVEVHYEGTIPYKTFTGEIPRTYTLPQVVEILAISQVQLSQNQKTIFIKP